MGQAADGVDMMSSWRSKEGFVSVKLGFTAWLARGFLRLLACIHLLIISNTYTALLALANVVVEMTNARFWNSSDGAYR